MNHARIAIGCRRAHNDPDVRKPSVQQPCDNVAGPKRNRKGIAGNLSVGSPEPCA